MLSEPAAAASASAGAEPMMRIFGDLGAWTLGQPLVAGSGAVVVQLGLDALEELVVALGVEGVRALRAVLRHATPVSEDGVLRLALPGYSGAWLREELGLSERLAYRASAALQEAGLIVTTSLPGARGAAGTQRAVLSPLVGVPGGAPSERSTKRGRGRASARGSAVSTRARNREQSSISDALAVSTKARNRDENPQVSAVSTTAQNRLSTGLSSSTKEGRKSFPTSDPNEAPEVTADSDALALSDAPSLWALQRALRNVEDRQPGALLSTLRPIVADRAAEAAQLARTLRMRGDEPPSTQVASWLVGVLTADPTDVLDNPGAAGAVFTGLRAAGVVVPRRLPPAAALARIAIGVTAGLDAKVSDWRRWMASALKRQAGDWGQTETPRRLAVVLNAAWRQDLSDEDPSSPTLADADSRAAPGVEDAPPDDHGDAALPDELVAEHLEAAVKAHPLYSHRAVGKVAANPPLAREVVRAYLATTPPLTS